MRPGVLELLEKIVDLQLVVCCRLCTSLLHVSHHNLGLANFVVGFVCHSVHVGLVFSGTVLDFSHGSQCLEVFLLVVMSLGFGFSECLLEDRVCDGGVTPVGCCNHTFLKGECFLGGVKCKSLLSYLA